MSGIPSWEEVSRIFDEAVEKPPEERRAWIEEVCAGDAGLRAEVLSLLAAHEAAEGFLDGSLLSGTAARLGLDPKRRSLPGAGRYRLVGEVGRGGMGVVYEGWDAELDRRVAIKVLAERLESDAARRRFRAEARAVSTLDHPGICTVHDLGETDDGRPFLVLGFYEGETLDQRLERGPLDAQTTQVVLVDMLRALGHAHRAGVVHRDIKPSNLLWTQEGRLKVLDFGIASVAGRETLTRSWERHRLGTPAYMAPERLRGDVGSPATDLWSVGVVLYELLTGRLPFPVGHPLALVDAILDREPDPLPEGLKVSRPLVRVLDRTLVRDPSRRARDAAELLELLALEEDRASVPIRSRKVPPMSLPRPLTSFVGRERELESVAERLASGRLLTLIGPGGAGKTRLALEAARRFGHRFADGVDFLSLAAVEESRSLGPAFARGLGLEARALGASLAPLIEELAEQERWIIVDNFERLVDVAGELQVLLEGCPRLHLLVTSRIRLRVSGEQTLEVGPLAMDPRADAPAIRLFLDRSRAVRPDLDPADLDPETVAEVCRRLDGLPLAIELAAARMRLFSLRALRDRLGQRLDQRLDLLRGGERDRPDRHRTLEQAVGWSYELLPAHGQALFRRLGVFRGGFSLPLVEVVVHAAGALDLEPADAVGDLLDQSLVGRGCEVDGEPRFQLLETLREVALRRLREAGEEEATRAAHARAMADLVEQAAPELTGPGQQRWIARLEAEHENIRAAFEWSTAARARDVGLRLGASFWRFWLVRGPLLEGCEILGRLAAGLSEQNLVPGRGAEVRVDPREAELLQGLATLEHNLGRNREAEVSLSRSLVRRRAVGDLRGVASVLSALGWVACETSDLERAEELSREALSLSRAFDDARGIAVAVNNLAWVAAYRGEFREAGHLFEESRAWRQQIGDRRGEAFELNGRAWAELRTGRPEEALVTLGRARRILEGVGDVLLLQWATLLEADVAMERGDRTGAIELLERTLEENPSAPNRSLEAWVRTLLAAATNEERSRDAARREVRTARPIWREIESAWGEAWTLALEGEIELDAGNLDAARGLLERSLEVRRRIGDRGGTAACLEGLAACLEQQPTVAAEKLGEARRIRQELGQPRPGLRAPALAALEERLRCDHVAEALVTGDRAGDGLATALLDEERKNDEEGRAGEQTSGRA